MVNNHGDPKSLGLFPFQMAVSWLINGGDPITPYDTWDDPLLQTFEAMGFGATDLAIFRWALGVSRVAFLRFFFESLAHDLKKKTPKR